MSKRELCIFVAGKPNSGKSRVLFLLKKFLRENGFEVDFDGGLDFNNEAQFDQQIGNRHFDAAIEAIKDNRKIVLREIQLQKSANAEQ